MIDVFFGALWLVIVPMVGIGVCLATVGLISGCVLFLLICIGGITGHFNGLKTEVSDD
jgi:hypothetical protein